MTELNANLLTPVYDGDNVPTIRFYEGQCSFRMTTQGGTTTERLIPWAALREAALGIPIDSGWLSPQVVRWGTGRLAQWTVAFIPPGPHLIELTKGTPGVDETADRITVPLPGMIIFGIALQYWVWALKTDAFNPHEPLYRAPLPNVMADASVCWGMLKPARPTPAGILSVWELFIKSTFNNHACSGKSRREPEDVRNLLRSLAQAGDDTMRYPVEDLCKQVESTGVTMDQAMKQFFETGEMPS